MPGGRVRRSAMLNLDHVEEFEFPAQWHMFVKLNDGLCPTLREANREPLRKLLTNGS